MERQFAAERERTNQQFAHLREQMERQFAAERERTDQQFAAINQRFADLLQYMDKRFEDMQRQFRMLAWLIGVGITLLSLLMTVYEFIR